MGFSRQGYWSGLPFPSPVDHVLSDQPTQHIKKQRHYFANKGPSSQSYGFSSSHVRMWELDYKERWALKNWCFWTVVLEKTLECPLDCKEIQPVHPKGDQSWIFIGRTDAETETPVLWPPDGKNWLIGKDPDAGKDWRQEEKGMTEDEIIAWHRLDRWESLSKLQELVMDREAWWASVHGVAKSWIRLSDWTELKLLFWTKKLDLPGGTVDKHLPTDAGTHVQPLVWEDSTCPLV